MAALALRLRELIAADAGISPDQVTTEYIEEQRRKKFYSTGSFCTTSIFGGYHVEKLQILTAERIDSNRKLAQQFLARFSS